MSDTPKKIGEYEVEREIGRGGMGVVYLAMDSKLHRPVAIKTLPQDINADPERLARFEREARVLASLNHSSVAGIHGIEQDGDSRFLVLEFVDGDTLSDRIRSGPMHMDEILSICAQIAQGVEAAHEAGVVHRDLKPANIKIDPEGEVKVLDFGLAKVGVDPASSMSSSSMTDSSDMPTMTMHTTQAGLILGTTGYMSPEQARGRRVDKRADIFSFGCILFECLTGQRAFEGETATDTISAIVSADPDWSLLPDATPPRVLDVLHRCLEKNPKDRLRDIGDARIELERAVRDRSWSGTQIGVPAEKAPRKKPDLRPWLGGALVGLLLGVSAFAFRSSPPPVEVPAGGQSGRADIGIRFAVETRSLASVFENSQPVVAIAPDASAIAVAGESVIFVRTLDDVQLRYVDGTRGGEGPFFSPDGQWIGFFAEGELRKVAIEGGTPLTICEATNPRGAAWLDDGTIVFAVSSDGSLQRVSAQGGEPERLSSIDESAGETHHRWPARTSDPNVLLMTVWYGGAFDAARIDLFNIETNERTTLIDGGFCARWIAPGTLVYCKQDLLHLASVDLESKTLIGTPTALGAGVSASPSTGAAHFDISQSGDLVFLPPNVLSVGSNMLWIDGQGKTEYITLEQKPYLRPALSPDKSKVVYPAWTRGNLDLWVYDFQRELATRATFKGRDWTSVWTPDSQAITWASTLHGDYDVLHQRLDEDYDPRRLTSEGTNEYPECWTPDGRFLIYSRMSLDAGLDLFYIEPEVSLEPRQLLATEFSEHSVEVSPDGNWFIYVSDESGEANVYAQRFPDLGGKVRISIDGGVAPTWGARGTTLYYQRGESIMSVRVAGKDQLEVGQPEEVQRVSRLASSKLNVSSDGRRFLVLESEPTPASRNLIVDLNWAARQELAPSGSTAAADESE